MGEMELKKCINCFQFVKKYLENLNKKCSKLKNLNEKKIIRQTV